MSDWSSDVCSSDLSFISAPDSPDETEQAVPRLRRVRGAGQGAAAAFATPKLFQADAVAATGLVDRPVARSHRGPHGLRFPARHPARRGATGGKGGDHARKCDFLRGNEILILDHGASLTDQDQAVVKIGRAHV